jgi:hypothetical protein
MTDEQRADSYARRDELRAIDHETLQVIRRWLFWSLTTGAVLIGGFIWHESRQEQRLVAIEAEAAIKRTRMDLLNQRLTTAETIAAGVGARMESQGRTLDRIETRLERLIERLEPRP